MISVQIKAVGLKDAQQFIGKLAKQMPFATAKALTVTARDVRDDVVKELPKHLDKPVAFTRHAFGYQSATKRKLQARIFAKSIQAQYLWWAVEGGTQDAMIQPANVKINKFGNIPRNKLKKLLARPDVFYGTVKGITGLWQRGKHRGSRFYAQARTVKGSGGKQFRTRSRAESRGLKLLAVRKSTVRYKTRFDFYGLAERTMDRVWQKNFDEAWRLALATAR